MGFGQPHAAVAHWLHQTCLLARPLVFVHGGVHVEGRGQHVILSQKCLGFCLKVMQVRKGIGF